MAKKEKFRKTRKTLKKYVSSPEKKTSSQSGESIKTESLSTPLLSESSSIKLLSPKKKLSSSDSVPLSKIVKNKIGVRPIVLKEKKPCPEGQERIDNKGHCKKIKVEKEKKIKTKKVKVEKEKKTKKIKEKKPCPEDQERIDNKGHCKKIKVEKEKKTRKIKKKSSSKSSKKLSKSSSAKSGSWSTDASSKLSNMSDLISDTGDELNEEQRKEFDEIIKNLQEGKLKGMNLDAKGSKGVKEIKEKPNSKELSINCLKMFDDIALEKELDKRRKEKAEKEKEEEEKKKPAINILVPRKKVPKA
jgi:hypothetical protein